MHMHKWAQKLSILKGDMKLPKYVMGGGLVEERYYQEQAVSVRKACKGGGDGL